MCGVLSEHLKKGADEVFPSQEASQASTKKPLPFCTDLFTDINQLVEFQRKVIDHSADALMVVDREGHIIYINDSFKEVHGVEEEEVLGQHVTRIIENTRMHIVAQTGVAEHDRFQDISGKAYIVSRIPIIENGECLGVVGMIRFRYMEEVQVLIDRIKSLQEELSSMQAERSSHVSTDYTFDDIMDSSPALRSAKDMAMQAAKTDATVLLRGESGVGKEFFAHSIHAHSPRRKGPFIRLNCSAIQENLIESELFGYEEGAFTGARKGGKKGKFELADGGTIFLDEIGDMPLAVQAKLLRAIQEGEIDPLGSEKRRKVNVRVLAATNKDLEEMIAAGEFREDLFYRINVIPIFLPPLRAIPEEISQMAKNIWKRLSIKHGIFHKRLTEDAFLVLQTHTWKGNCRELQNVLERAMVIVRHDRIDRDDIQRVLFQNHAYGELSEAISAGRKLSLNDLVGETEKRALRCALESAAGNRSNAAKILNISRPLLYKKLKKYGLE